MVIEQKLFSERRPTLNALRQFIDTDKILNVSVIRNPQGCGYLVRWHRGLTDLVHPVDTVLQGWHYYSGLREAYSGI